MSSKKAFDRGMFAGILLMLGAQGLYWFITTSAHPDASSLRTALVALQCVVGFGGTLWLLRSRTDGSPTRASRGETSAIIGSQAGGR